MTQEQIELFTTLLKESVYTVVVTGAGISTASGLKDFRGADGLYTKGLGLPYPPDFLLSRTGFYRKPKIAYEFYRKYLFQDVKPNKAHYILADWEKRGIIKSIITQNIDNLHEDAGSQHVLDIHGNMTRFYCPKCNKKFSYQYAKDHPNVAPRCDKCKNNVIIRPDIVMYEEPMKKSVAKEAFEEILKANLVIAIGSTLEVSTIHDMIYSALPKPLVIINKGETAFDDVMSSFKIEEDIVEVVETINNSLSKEGVNE